MHRRIDFNDPHAYIAQGIKSLGQAESSQHLNIHVNLKNVSKQYSNNIKQIK